MSFYASEQSKSLNDLKDTSIVTPINDDAPVYNSTTQKWENKQITTKEQWKKNGAYNLCPNTASSTVGEGITYTVNSDGTVSAGGGVSVNNWGISITTGLKLRKGTYKLCGTPSGGNYNTTYSLYVSVGGVTVASDTPNTVGVTDTFTVSDETASHDVMIIIRGGIDLTTPITFKPMITTDLNATYDDYVPYAKTNRELTEYTKVSKEDITWSDTYIDRTERYTKLSRMGKIAVFVGGYVKVNTAIPNNTKFATLPVDVTEDLMELAFVGNQKAYMVGARTNHTSTAELYSRESIPTGNYMLVGTILIY